jgi:hypothetical protein
VLEQSSEDELSIKALRNALEGAVVVGSEPGIGSFFYLQLSKTSDSLTRVWVYLCDWAFCSDGYEFASSDIPKIGGSLDLSSLVGERLISIEILDSGPECHFDFTGGFRLEMWLNDSADGNEAEMFMVFQNATHMMSYPVSRRKAKHPR